MQSHTFDTKFDAEVGVEVLDEPYSDTGCVKRQGWTGSFELNRKLKDWLKPRVSCHFFGHSRNWCMGSLTFDILFFSFELGPIDLFFAYRFRIYPPNLGVRNAKARPQKNL